jgi:hypothetical protein
MRADRSRQATGFASPGRFPLDRLCYRRTRSPAKRHSLPDLYSSFQISAWQSRDRKRSPWLCLALTPPSPGGLIITHISVIY